MYLLREIKGDIMAHFKEFKPVNNVTKQPKKTANTLAVIVIFIVSVCSVLACFFSGYLAIKDFRSKNTAYADELISSYSTFNYYALMSSITGQGDNVINNWETDYYPTLNSQGYIEQRNMAVAQPNIGISFVFSNFRTRGETNYLDITFNFVESDLSNFANGFSVRDSSNTNVIDNKITVFGGVTGNTLIKYIPNVYDNSTAQIYSIHKSGTSSITQTNYFIYSQPSSGNTRYIVPMYFNFHNIGSTFDYRCYKVSARIIPFYKQEIPFVFWLNYRFYFITDTTNESFVDMLFFQCANNTYLPFYYNVINYTYYSQYFANAEYVNGYGEGYNLGYDTGYSSGSSIGESVGYNNGYTTGYTEGDLQGYNRGINSAHQFTFFNLLSAVVDAPVQALTGLLNFNILGFNMLNFFTGLLTLAIILFIVRKILGG